MARWSRQVEEDCRPGSRVQGEARRDILAIVKEDHVQKMLTGITRYGSPRAPLSPRTLANRKRGPGPSLVPRLRQSRYITTFLATWAWEGMTGAFMGGRSVLSMSFLGFTSPRGFPIPMAHELGARRGKWTLPPRPVMGVTPVGMKLIEDRMTKLSMEIARGH